MATQWTISTNRAFCETRGCMRPRLSTSRIREIATRHFRTRLSSSKQELKLEHKRTRRHTRIQIQMSVEQPQEGEERIYMTMSQPMHTATFHVRAPRLKTSFNSATRWSSTKTLEVKALRCYHLQWPTRTNVRQVDNRTSPSLSTRARRTWHRKMAPLLTIATRWRQLIGTKMADQLM